MTGSAFVFIGGAFIIYTEESVETLQLARRALMSAQDASTAFEVAREFALDYEEAAIMLRALYLVYSSSRNVLEYAATSGGFAETTAYQTT